MDLPLRRSAPMGRTQECAASQALAACANACASSVIVRPAGSPARMRSVEMSSATAAKTCSPAHALWPSSAASCSCLGVWPRPGRGRRGMPRVRPAWPRQRAPADAASAGQPAPRSIRSSQTPLASCRTAITSQSTHAEVRNPVSASRGNERDRQGADTQRECSRLVAPFICLGVVWPKDRDCGRVPGHPRGGDTSDQLRNDAVEVVVDYGVVLLLRAKNGGACYRHALQASPILGRLWGPATARGRHS